MTSCASAFVVILSRNDADGKGATVWERLVW
jgi:hypothetical protein